MGRHPSPAYAPGDADNLSCQWALAPGPGDARPDRILARPVTSREFLIDDEDGLGIFGVGS
jgi:hypothetical protein